MKLLASISLALVCVTAMMLSAQEPGESVFRHVVLFKFKEGTTEEQITQVEDAFGQLPSRIDTIVDYEWGTSQTVEEGLDQGYTHCFFVTFADKAGLEEYLPHPDHKEFVALVGPLLDEVHVFDYAPGE